MDPPRNARMYKVLVLHMKLLHGVMLIECNNLYNFLCVEKVFYHIFAMSKTTKPFICVYMRSRPFLEMFPCSPLNTDPDAQLKSCHRKPNFS